MVKDNEPAFIFVNSNEKSRELLEKYAGIPAILSVGEFNPDIFSDGDICGVSGSAVSAADYDFMKEKRILKNAGIDTNTFESSIPFGEFKLNADGLIPVIVQDYKTDEVLMLAYMNEESYNATIQTGRMTYYSRSRNELWTKGETSGHFQYVRSIEIDCDNDTLLAKVKQICAACHTGNRSCFYRNLIATEYAETNPLKIFNSVMDIIEDRKQHPKEGSYTNYLFDKGIDKILKKCGEEATEIVIAAKNPDPEEIKYEISDFLYHVMVLMVLKGVTWDDIVKELANR
jgi:phosphoribosyl-ATP pyrophosphohydrolase/phosphoribosyl-AMP cyclohydrolase